jgi:hypothetical protein
VNKCKDDKIKKTGKTEKNDSNINKKHFILVMKKRFLFLLIKYVNQYLSSM